MSIHTILSQMEEEFEKKFTIKGFSATGEIRIMAGGKIEDGKISAFHTGEVSAEPVLKFMRSFATRIVEEVGKELKKMRLKHKDYEYHVHIYSREGTGKCHICQMSWKESTRQGIYNQALSDICTKLQKMKI